MQGDQLVCREPSGFSVPPSIVMDLPPLVSYPGIRTCISVIPWMKFE